MNAVEKKLTNILPPRTYWRLWLLDNVLVSAGLWFFLATRYGTFEFFGRALLMALLPLIPLLVLVGGAGSTIFALAKIFAERRGLKQSAAVALLVGQALALTAPLAVLGVWKSSTHQLSYICAGHAPLARDVRLAGYSTFLREEWLAVFRTDEKSFQAFVAEGKFAPADGFEFEKALEHSRLKNTRLGKSLPPLTNQSCFQRVFKDKEEHERGTIFATYDATNLQATVFRGYHD